VLIVTKAIANTPPPHTHGYGGSWHNTMLAQILMYTAWETACCGLVVSDSLLLMCCDMLWRAVLCFAGRACCVASVCGVTCTSAI
jgi:hypothetical protein